MRKVTMFIIAVCVLFFIKLRWTKNKSFSTRSNINDKSDNDDYDDDDDDDYCDDDVKVD